MVRTRFALISYFRMVAHKAACHTLSKAFLKSMKTWYRFCWCWRYFSHRILRLKICSVVLLPALNPACSSAIISSAWGLSLFKITFSMTLPDLYTILPGRVAQSVGHLTRKSGVLGSIPGLATYFRFSFRFFKKGSCQLLAEVCARSTG